MDEDSSSSPSSFSASDGVSVAGGDSPPGTQVVSESILSSSCSKSANSAGNLSAGNDMIDNGNSENTDSNNDSNICIDNSVNTNSVLNGKNSVNTNSVRKANSVNTIVFVMRTITVVGARIVLVVIKV